LELGFVEKGWRKQDIEMKTGGALYLAFVICIKNLDLDFAEKGWKKTRI